MKMLKSNIIRIVVLAVFSVVMLWGCAGNLPESKRVDYLKQNWGKSFESAKKNQILNPEAGKVVEPVIGLDGQVVEHNLDNRKKSFEEQKEIETSTAFTISQ